MTVAIIGGSGMIGRALTASLVADGHRVVVLSREPARHGAPTTSAGVTVVAWSVDDIDGLGRTLDGVDAVVNLAGAKVGPRRWTAGRKRLLRSSRIEPTRAVVDAIASLPAERRPRVLVSASGTDGYTRHDDIPLTEVAAGAEGFLGEVCRDWEGAALRAEALGVRVVCIRSGPVIAREATVLRLLALPVRFGIGGRLGSGDQWISWIHVDDLVDVLRRVLADDRLHGPINAVAPESVRQIDLTRAIGRRMNRPVWTRVPAWLLRIVIGEGASVVLGSRRVRPARLESAAFEFRYPTIDLALQEALR